MAPLTNVSPLAILAVVAAIILFRKGYIPLPGSLVNRPAGNPAAHPAFVAQAPAPWQPGPALPELARYNSADLGLAFARAKRAESSHMIDVQLAEAAAAAIQTTHTAPFSAPSTPAGAPVSQSGPNVANAS